MASDPPHSSRAQLRRIVERWIDLWRPGNLAAFDDLHAERFIDRSSAGRDSSRDGFRRGIVDLLRAFPDFAPRIDDLVIDESAQTVAVRWSATGTHRTRYLGAEPTGRSIKFRGIEIVRVVGARIVERWGEWDGLDLCEQLQRPT